MTYAIWPSNRRVSGLTKALKELQLLYDVCKHHSKGTCSCVGYARERIPRGLRIVKLRKSPRSRTDVLRSALKYLIRMTWPDQLMSLMTMNNSRSEQLCVTLLDKWADCLGDRGGCATEIIMFQMQANESQKVLWVLYDAVGKGNRVLFWSVWRLCDDTAQQCRSRCFALYVVCP